MMVKKRLLALKLAEKEKKNPKFFEEIKIDVKITNNECDKKVEEVK